MITVNELFTVNFAMYFDKIKFYDETNNIQDTMFINNGHNDYDEKAWNEFLEAYGEYYVTEWQYMYYNNTIDITIEE